MIGEVVDFALSPDGRRLAAVRGRDGATELWTASVDGPDLRPVATDRRRIEAPDWSSRNVLAFASSGRMDTREEGFVGWGEWCAEAEIRRWDEDGGTRPLVAGCDPAWAPEGLRLALAGRPTMAPEGDRLWPTSNALRLVNWQGENAWDVVRLERDLPPGLAPERPGMFLYRPAWSPNGESVVYGRFVGYALACNHSTIERTGARSRGVELLGLADWIKRLTVSADGRFLAVDQDLCNAPGFGGYNTVGLRVLDLSRPTRISGYPILGEPPDHQVPMGATRVFDERRAHSPAWSPTGAALAYLRPPPWPGGERPTPDPASPYNGTAPADLVVRDLVTGESTRLFGDVDFGSPLAWAP